MNTCPPNQDSRPSPQLYGPGSLSSESSTGPSFVKIPPAGYYVLNERLVKLPFVHVPNVLSNQQSKYFQSRNSEIEHIKGALFPKHLRSDGLNTLNHRICTITGLGGIGKTELSFRFFTKFKDDLDAIFFVVADSESRLREEYSQIAMKLGLIDANDQKDTEASSEVFRLWLADPIRGIPDFNTAHATVTWLLVYDNAKSTDTLEKFWPAGNCGKILITSRNPLIAPRGLFSSALLRLEGLPTKDAVQLLQTYSNDHRNDAQSIEDASQTVEWVKGLPMAVKQLGSIISMEHLTISQFRRIWTTKHKLLRRFRDGQGGEDNLATVWALETLYERHRSSFELLGVLSMLDPELVPHELLMMSSQISTPNGPLVDEASYIASRKHLADTSLVDVSRETGDLRIHRLVQGLVRDFIIQRNQAALFFCRAVSYVAYMWPFLNRNYKTGTATNIDRWEICRRVFPHILHLKDVYEDWSNSGFGVAIPTDLPELLLEAVQYCNERGVGHEAIALVETADNMYRGISFDKPLGVTYETRAKIYRARIGLAVSSKEGDDIFEFAQQVFEIEKYQHQDRDEPSSILAVAYNDLATGWAFRRKWATAVELLTESKKIRERLPGFTGDKLFSPLYHLGIVYHHQGDFDAAEITLKQAIEDRSATFGPKDTRSVRSAALYYALGNMKLDRADRRRGDLMKALGDFKTAVDISTTCMGAKNRTTLLCKFQVAKAAIMLQDYATARDLLDEVLTHWIDNTMYERDTARIAYFYAHYLEVQGMREESLVWFNKALSIHNRKRTGNSRTLETLTQADIDALIPYDFL
ncbi:P-loop containing nucleoside triphosphate hydrolase protein [Xylaria cubensis]|nr:P-loop containing nucleoside triphosphate hydrolase protein [Xylaria cubensis]